MILKHLINSKSFVIFFIIIFLLAFNIIPFIRHSFFNVYDSLFFNPIIEYVFGTLLVFINAMKLNNIIYEKSIIRKNNLVVASVFLLLNTFFINNLLYLIHCYVILVFLDILFASYQRKYPFSNFFNSGLVIGFLSLFFLNLITCYIIILVTGITFNNLNWRTFIASLIGLIIPFIFYFMFLFSLEITTFSTYILPLFNTEQKILYSSSSLFMIISFILSFCLSIRELFGWIYKKSIRSRKSFIVILSFLCICIAIFIISNYTILYFFIIPFSIIIANYLIYYRNRIIAELVFLLLIGSSFIYRYMIIL